MVSDERFFVWFSHCKYMGENVPWGGASEPHVHHYQDLCKVTL